MTNPNQTFFLPSLIPWSITDSVSEFISEHYLLFNWVQLSIKFIIAARSACQFLTWAGTEEVFPQLIDLGRAHPKTKSRAVENGELSHVASLEEKKAEDTSPSSTVKCAWTHIVDKRGVVLELAQVLSDVRCGRHYFVFNITSILFFLFSKLKIAICWLSAFGCLLSFSWWALSGNRSITLCDSSLD